MKVVLNYLAYIVIVVLAAYNTSIEFETKGLIVLVAAFTWAKIDQLIEAILIAADKD